MNRDEILKRFELTQNKEFYEAIFDSFWSKSLDLQKLTDEVLQLYLAYDNKLKELLDSLKEFNNKQKKQHD
jgi:hypothetical protein